MSKELNNAALNRFYVVSISLFSFSFQLSFPFECNFEFINAFLLDPHCLEFNRLRVMIKQVMIGCSLTF